MWYMLHMLNCMLWHRYSTYVVASIPISTYDWIRSICFWVLDIVFQFPMLAEELVILEISTESSAMQCKAVIDQLLYWRGWVDCGSWQRRCPMRHRTLANSRDCRGEQLTNAWDESLSPVSCGGGLHRHAGMSWVSGSRNLPRAGVVMLRKDI